MHRDITDSLDKYLDPGSIYQNIVTKYGCRAMCALNADGDRDNAFSTGARASPRTARRFT
jgi:hypothetical protein